MAEQAGGTQGAGSDWARLQQEFLAQWFGGATDPATPMPWQKLTESFTQAVTASVGDSAKAGAPWQSFSLFAALLGEQAQLLRAGRKRKVDVAAALKALLENLVRNIDVVIAAQALIAGDKAMGTAPFTLNQAFAEWPALGLTREWQQRLQRCWHAMAAEREAGAHLRTLQWRALRAGCERCGRALSAPGPAITSLRGLYDLFVDSVEMAWRETAMTDEYARVFGAQVNASLALRVALRDCLQPVAGLLELAGRAELDAIDRRLRELEARLPLTGERVARREEIAEAPPAPATARPRAKATAAPRRERAPLRAAPKRAPRRAEFDIGNVIARGDDSE